MYDFARDQADGLTLTEREIMRRWDAGQSAQAIAHDQRMRVARVKQIIVAYHDSGECRRAASAIAQGSRRLAAAILQARSSHA